MGFQYINFEMFIWQSTSWENKNQSIELECV